MYKHVPDLNPVNDASHKDALIGGWLLDQNIYDLQALLASDQQVDLLNIAQLGKWGFTVDDTVAFMQKLGAPGPMESAETHMAFLSTIIASMPARLTSFVSAQAKAGAGNAASMITWQGLLPWGAGTGVILHMLPGGIPTGSQPDSEPVWMKTVEQHHPRTNTTTLYVRGHLLNHNIGGPGLDYNMVPITGKPAKNVGANDANGEHLRAIETTAKNTWDAVRLGRLMEATYTVVPKYGRVVRAETHQVRAAERAMRVALENANAAAVAKLQQLKPHELQLQWQAKAGGMGIKVWDEASQQMQEIAVSPQQKIEMLARAETTAAERDNVGVLRASSNAVMAAVDAAVSGPLLNASAEGVASRLSLGELYAMLNGNAETWEAEDRYIPTALTVSLESVDLSGVKTTIGPLGVPVTLSTQIDNVYYRPKKKAELA